MGMNDGEFKKILEEHTELFNRNKKASSKLDQLRQKFDECHSVYDGKQVTIYCAGSLGRGDVGEHSDLDIFILAEDCLVRLNDLEILANVININRELGYGHFSNDGRYLKVYSLKKMLETLGAPLDDNENLFTARMLLLLESRPVFNNDLYDNYLTRIIDHYFRDKRGKQSFRPLFLLNDLLRFWRTLCLNYELVRDEPTRPWRKKNINLKFSRMLTVFGTVLPVIAKPITDSTELKELAVLTPLQRFAEGLDILADRNLKPDFFTFLNSYESFLLWKEQMGGKNELTVDEDLDKRSRVTAQEFSSFIYKTLSHDKIENDFKKYLVL